VIIAEPREYQAKAPVDGSASTHPDMLSATTSHVGRGYEGVYDLKCRSGRADHLSFSRPGESEAVLEPAGVASEGDDFDVVEEPVEDGGGEDLVAKDFTPASGDELEDHVGFGPFRYTSSASTAREGPAVNAAIMTMIRMHTMHRESPATRAAFRQVQPSQREGQLDDGADYQSAYQSVRSTSHMQAHLRPLPALRAGKSRQPTVDGMKEVRGSRLVAPPLRPYSTPARQSRMDDAG